MEEDEDSEDGMIMMVEDQEDEEEEDEPEMVMEADEDDDDEIAHTEDDAAAEAVAAADGDGEGFGMEMEMEMEMEPEAPTGLAEADPPAGRSPHAGAAEVSRPAPAFVAAAVKAGEEAEHAKTREATFAVLSAPKVDVATTKEKSRVPAAVKASTTVIETKDGALVLPNEIFLPQGPVTKVPDSMIIRLPRADGKSKASGPSRAVGPPKAKRIRTTPPPTRPKVMPAAAVAAAQAPKAAEAATAPKPKHKPGSDTIVILPGSQSVLIGRASDRRPVSARHVVARWVSRESPCEARGHDDRIAVPPDREPTCAETFRRLDADVRRGSAAGRSRGPATPAALRPPVPVDQVKVFNAQMVPERFEDEATYQKRYQYIDTSGSPPCVVGNDAFRIDPQEPYELFFPILRGRLHTTAHRGVQATLEDLHVIWSTVLEEQLGIPSSEFQNYKVLLVIPDLYHRRTVQHFFDVALRMMGFCAAMCHVESVCTSFGAGLQSCCVVNVGDRCTAIACVEDGVSITPTRLELAYGGRDVQNALFRLLQSINFPYAECDLARYHDRLIVEELSLRLCHLALDNYAISTHEFFVRREKRLLKYGLKVADHGIAALMGLFYPAFFGLTADDGVVRATPDRSALPEDSILGEDHIPEFQMMAKGAADGAAKSGGAAAQFVAVPTRPTDKGTESPAELLALDEAIMRSISRCPTDTVVKNMYQSILLVGGCAAFAGFGRFLEQRLWAQLPVNHRRLVDKERLHVTTKPKSTEPRFVAWRGASVVARLSASQDAWVLQSEWEDLGIRAVREKVPFMW